MSFNFVRISFKSFYNAHLCCWYPPNSSEFMMAYSVWWTMPALWVCLTTVHALGGCSITLSQDHFTNQHNQVLHSLVSKLSDCLERLSWLSPTFSLTYYITHYIYNETSAVLTCSMDFIHHERSLIHHLNSVRQETIQEENFQILSELGIFRSSVMTQLNLPFWSTMPS